MSCVVASVLQDVTIFVFQNRYCNTTKDKKIVFQRVVSTAQEATEHERNGHHWGGALRRQTTATAMRLLTLPNESRDNTCCSCCCWCSLLFCDDGPSQSRRFVDEARSKLKCFIYIVGRSLSFPRDSLRSVHRSKTIVCTRLQNDFRRAARLGFDRANDGRCKSRAHRIDRPTIQINSNGQSLKLLS